MSAARDAFEKAMIDLLKDEGEIAGADLVTHYVLVYATVDEDGDDDAGVMLSGPNDGRGIPAWQAKGLLRDGLELMAVGDCCHCCRRDED